MRGHLNVKKMVMMVLMMTVTKAAHQKSCVSTRVISKSTSDWLVKINALS